MKKLISNLALLATLFTTSFHCLAIDGKWTGDLNVSGITLPLVLNLNLPDSCTLDSPQQLAYGIPVKVDHISADSLAWSCTKIGAWFQGRIEGQEIKGSFVQMGMKFPLTFKPEEPLSIRRPQTPVPPFPYQTVDTVFHSSDGTLLSGTLTIPDKPAGKKYPMVVMVTGSGQQNRDEEMYDHKPFAVIADYLARRGIASFRYDDRGTAKSQGSFAEALPETIKDDARAALEFSRKFNNGGKIGILGHSEGGTNALLLAADGIPDFIISLAGMSVSGKETILDQNRHLIESQGLNPQQVSESMNLIEKSFAEIMEQAKTGVNLPINVDSLAATSGTSIPPIIVASVKDNVAKRTPYFGKMLLLDARESMGKIKCPVLAINGSLDTQVDAAKNLQAIRDYIPHAKVYELPGLNHLLQLAKTGEFREYVYIKETISPEVLGLIADFVLKEVK